MSIVDTPQGGDFFAGGGGASKGVLDAGLDLRFAANHDDVAIATHAHNHPDVDHHHVDLLEYDVAKLPRVQLAHFSPSCVHHSEANATRQYEQPATLFDVAQGNGPDPVADAGYASSERSRVTMSCVLRYANAHHPDLMIVENVIAATKWGPAKDGSTFRWWRNEIEKMGYKTKPMFLNSAAFGVPQKRDRLFVVCWDRRLRDPDLDHHTDAWCPNCERTVDARQVFRHRTKKWPMADWGHLDKQYDYRCTTCHHVATIGYAPASSVIDWSDPGQLISERLKPLAPSTMDRIARGIARHGNRVPHVHDYQGNATGIDCPTSTLTASETHALVIPFRKHTNPTSHDEPTFTMTAQQRPGLVHWNHAPTSAMFAKNNGGPADTAYHATVHPFGTMTARDTTSLVTTDLDHPTAEDVLFRMLRTHEVRKIMGYDDRWEARNPDGTPANNTDVMRLLGDGITPPVLTWLTNQALATLNAA